MLDIASLDAAVDRHAEAAFDLLARLVAAPSTVGQEAESLSVFAEALTDLGFAVHWLDIPADIADDARAGVPQPGVGDRRQVVGSIGPATGRSLLLNGHMDVVPAQTPDRWVEDPFAPRRDGDRMYGRGVGDMKAGFAMGMLALRSLLEVRPQALTGRLSFLAAIEEECTGNGTLSAARSGVLADAVVVLEPTDLQILIGGVGVLWCDVEVDGVSSHAESAHLAINPLDLLSRLLGGLRAWAAQLAEHHPDPALAEVESPYNLNLGQVSAGDWPSSVPTTATMRLRVGFPRAWTPAEAERTVRGVVADLAAADGGFPSPPRVSSGGLRARGYHLDPGHLLVGALAAAHRHAHGSTPRTFSLGSTTDARFYINDFGVPAVCYGPAAANIHGVDESVDLRSVVAGARVLARFIAEWFTPGVVIAR